VRSGARRRWWWWPVSYSSSFGSLHLNEIDHINLYTAWGLPIYVT
jgi:hypothetical protein